MREITGDDDDDDEGEDKEKDEEEDEEEEEEEEPLPVIGVWERLTEEVPSESFLKAIRRCISSRALSIGSFVVQVLDFAAEASIFTPPDPVISLFSVLFDLTGFLPFVSFPTGARGVWRSIPIERGLRPEGLGFVEGKRLK